MTASESTLASQASESATNANHSQPGQQSASARSQTDRSSTTSDNTQEAFTLLPANFDTTGNRPSDSLFSRGGHTTPPRDPNPATQSKAPVQPTESSPLKQKKYGKAEHDTRSMKMDDHYTEMGQREARERLKVGMSPEDFFNRILEGREKGTVQFETVEPNPERVDALREAAANRQLRPQDTPSAQSGKKVSGARVTSAQSSTQAESPEAQTSQPQNQLKRKLGDDDGESATLDGVKPKHVTREGSMYSKFVRSLILLCKILLC